MSGRGGRIPRDAGGVGPAARLATMVAPGPPGAAPIVLLHGWLATKELWALVLPELGARYPVVAMDLPGFGASPPVPGRGATPEDLAAGVAAECRARGLTGITLVGHSLGAVVATTLAAAEPELVARLVLANPPTPGGLRRAARPVLGPAGPFVVEVIHAGTLLAALMVPRLPSTGPRAARWAMAASTPPSVLLDALRALPRAAVYAHLAEIAVPTLVVTSDHDRATPGEEAALFVEGLPRAELVTLLAAGHHPMLESPEELTAAIVAWLER